MTTASVSTGRCDGATGEGAAPAAPRVHLVGAGPGDPELLTLKAARLLHEADVVLHDALVDPRVLALAARARLVDVGKRCGGASASQRFINRVLVNAARKPQRVVRLKGGDPVVFGRLDEEARALEAAGITFEVVPGVTAASAAAASLKVSLTLRGIARGVRFVTPRAAPGEAPAGADSLRGAHGETIAIYMAGDLLGEVATQLMDQGHAPGTPVAIVENASRDDEQRWTGTLATVAQWDGRRAGGPVLVLVGAALQALNRATGVEGAIRVAA
jgi:uroporphyrin-III C-methyltransferase